MKEHVESLLFGVWMNDLESLRSKLIEKKQSGFEMTGFRSEINVYSWTSM